MEWIKNIIIISIIIEVMQWLLPEGSFHKYIQFVFSLILLTSILTPALKYPAVTTSLEIPSGLIVTEEENKDYNKDQSLELIQEIQISDLIKDRIRREVYSILKEEISGISENDIEVYIEQRSLDPGISKRCLITIQTQEYKREKEIRRILSERLDLTGITISVVPKKEEE